MVAAALSPADTSVPAPEVAESAALRSDWMLSTEGCEALAAGAAVGVADCDEVPDAGAGLSAAPWRAHPPAPITTAASARQTTQLLALT